MSKLSDIFVSAVVVFDAEATKAPAKVVALSKLLKGRYSNYEILVIDNGLPTDQLKKLQGLLESVACLRIIRLSRTHDTDTAIFAGVEASIGDIICVLYQSDPVKTVPLFVDTVNQGQEDLVFGLATNLRRKSGLENMGARLFYWYSKKYLGIDIPAEATYFIAMNRNAANALTRSGRFMRHIRHMSKQVGFTSTNLEYELEPGNEVYASVRTATVLSRAVDLVSNYSSHPLRAITYFGIFAGFLNIVYAVYVVIVNLSTHNVERGWTTLSLQSSMMFFILFMILAILAEYVGKILNQTQQEPPYHIMQELSSTISIADETRRNVTT